MKLIKIELIEGSQVATTDDGRTLQPVILKFRKFWGNKIEIKAYPTMYGPIFQRSGVIRYFIYCDEFGKEFDHEICKRINNYLINIKFSK
jgi:hypothetical protein